MYATTTIVLQRCNEIRHHADTTQCSHAAMHVWPMLVSDASSGGAFKIPLNAIQTPCLVQNIVELFRPPDQHLSNASLTVSACPTTTTKQGMGPEWIVFRGVSKASELVWSLLTGVGQESRLKAFLCTGSIMGRMVCTSASAMSLQPAWHVHVMSCVLCELQLWMCTSSHCLYTALYLWLKCLVLETPNAAAHGIWYSSTHSTTSAIWWGAALLYIGCSLHVWTETQLLLSEWCICNVHMQLSMLSSNHWCCTCIAGFMAW